MFKMFTNPSGNITIALLLMVIAAMSGFTMSSLGLRDTVAFQYDYEAIQTMLFLRSEAYRGQKIAQRMGSVLIPVRTSVRNIEVTHSALRKTFNIQSLIAQGAGINDEPDFSQDVVSRQFTIVKSLVKSKTGAGPSVLYNPKFSMIRKYGVYTLETETFAKYMYFTDTDESMAGQNVYFYGPDLTYGRVHSNSDIWIKQAGGGTNGGWPTFYGLVSTAGHIQSWSGAYSVTQIFQGGLIEESAPTIFPEQATTIRRNGNPVGPLYYDPNHIMFVTVNGVGYTSMLGTVLEPRRVFSDVYNPYPPPNPNTYLYRNNYTVTDTVWNFYNNGTTVNRSNFVNGKLWLQGTFQTYQTWGCADTLFILGDILLSGTPKGNDPINNPRDVVGLVSEKSIVIKYGYRDPVDSLRYFNTCGHSTPPIYGGVWIYAAMAALGDGHGNTFKDGVFTFEYQHPHPSVPDVLINGVAYTKIDLHRYHFPQTAAFPWAKRDATTPVDLRIDFPWYNPLWPQRVPYLERGFISIYGSISQRRRGFVHRSYLDSEWPSGGVWNQPIDYCGGSSSPAVVSHIDPVLNIQLTTQNYPGATGSGVGYNKNYHYDHRFYKTSPIDFPEVNRADETPFSAVNWVIKRPPENL